MTNINELLNEANELVPRISFEDAKAILDDPNTIILDVREGQELRESGKIKGAIHVPRGLLEFVFRPEDYVEDPKKIKILVYCAAGARAALAAKTLLYIGYKDVFNLGGFKEWVENGGEIEVI
jgi:rhodanese-related sulfurtransferase